MYVLNVRKNITNSSRRRNLQIEEGWTELKRSQQTKESQRYLSTDFSTVYKEKVSTDEHGDALRKIVQRDA